eukprot:gene9576-6860_t
MKISLNREIRIGFGGLVLVENVPNKKTSMAPRARYQCHDIISSRYHFFLLDTEEFVVRTNWAENVPLTEALIDRINEIAARDEQLMVHNAEKGLGRKLAKLSYKPTPWSGSMEVKHGEALSTVVENMSPTIIDRKSIPQIQVDGETAMTKRPAVQRVEELFMEQDQHDEGPDHRGPNASMHQTDQSSCRGADPHVEPVVAPDAPAEEFPDDTAAVDNENETSTDAEVNLGRERGILPARALGIHADGLEDAVEAMDAMLTEQDNGAQPQSIRPLSSTALSQYNPVFEETQSVLCKRVKPDMLTAVSYLTTRVKCPTDKYLEKLTRVLKYLNATKGLSIVLEQTSRALIAYIDASYYDYKSHSRLIVTLGKGPLIVSSSKQRLNTKSSTEAELVETNLVMSSGYRRSARNKRSTKGWRLIAMTSNPIKLLKISEHCPEARRAQFATPSARQDPIYERREVGRILKTGYLESHWRLKLLASLTGWRYLSSALM